MKITIQELANLVNNKMKDFFENNDDGRIKELSERRIRDYISKDLLHKGFKDGKYTYYDQSHVDKLLTLRQLQDEGIQERTLQKLNYSSSISSNVNIEESNEEKENLLSVLSSIQSRNKSDSLPKIDNLNFLTKSASLMSALNNQRTYEVKTKKEYVISENISLIVSENNITKEEQENALKSIKEIFNKL